MEIGNNTTYTSYRVFSGDGEEQLFQIYYYFPIHDIPFSAAEALFYQSQAPTRLSRKDGEHLLLKNPKCSAQKFELTLEIRHSFFVVTCIDYSNDGEVIHAVRCHHESGVVIRIVMEDSTMRTFVFV